MSLTSVSRNIHSTQSTNNIQRLSTSMCYVKAEIAGRCRRANAAEDKLRSTDTSHVCRVKSSNRRLNLASRLPFSTKQILNRRLTGACNAANSGEASWPVCPSIRYFRSKFSILLFASDINRVFKQEKLSQVASLSIHIYREEFFSSNLSEDVPILLASQTLKNEKLEPRNLAIFGAHLPSSYKTISGQ